MPKSKDFLVPYCQVKKLIKRSHPGMISGDAVTTTDQVMKSVVKELIKPIPSILREWRRRTADQNILKTANSFRSTVKIIGVESAKREGAVVNRNTRPRKKRAQENKE